MRKARKRGEGRELISLALKVHSQNICFYSRFDEVFYSALSLTVASSSKGVGDREKGGGRGEWGRLVSKSVPHKIQIKFGNAKINTISS